MTWEGFAGKEVLRRNGSWHNTPTDDMTSLVDTNVAPGDYSYSIRVWQGGIASGTDCGTVTAA